MTETKEKKTRTPKVKSEPVLRPGLPKKEDGTVDWRAIVGDENLILNRFYWAKKGKDTETLEAGEIERLKQSSPDEGLTVLLRGFRKLAEARGVKSVDYHLADRTDERATVVAKIVLTPNADEPYERTISGIANCSVMNSTPDFFVHAEALASNRASNRAWREYLNINSVSFEEINPLEKAPEVANIPQLATVLLAKLKDHGKTEADIPKIIGGMFELGAWDGSISSMDPEEILATLPLVK